MFTTQVKIGVVVMALCLPLVACAAEGTDPGASEPPTSFKIAAGPDPGFSAPFIAIDQGFFEDNGIAASMSLASSGAAGLELLLAGEVDAALTVDIPGIRATAQGADIRIVTALNTSPGYVGIVSTGDISTAQDLAGKTVAVVQNASADYFFAKYLDSHGVDPASIEVLFMEPPEMVASLKQGFVDAYVAWGTWLVAGTDEVPESRILVTAEEDNLYLNTVFLYVSPEVAADSDLSERVLTSLMQASEFTTDNPAEAKAIMVEEFDMEAELVEYLYSFFEWELSLTTEIVDTYTSVAEWMLENDLIEEMPDIDTLFVPDHLREVAPDQVTL